MSPAPILSRQVQALQRGDYWMLPKDLVVAQTLGEDFEDYTTWTLGGAGSLADNSSEYKTGSKSMKFTTPASAGNVTATKSCNFTCDGNIRLYVYCHDSTIPSDANIYLSNDVAAFTNSFNIYRNQGGHLYRQAPGWNLIHIRTSEWTTNGAGSWSNPIRQIRIRFDTAANAHSYSVDSLYYNVVTLPAICFQFDDGLISHYDTAFPILRSRNIRGTDFIESGDIGNTGYLKEKHIKELYSANWNIANHTNSTNSLAGQSQANQETALSACDTVLAGYGIGNSRKHVAYPGGGHDANTELAMAAQSMLSGRTIHTSNQVDILPMTYPFHLYIAGGTAQSTTLAAAKVYVDNTVSRRGVGMIYFHAISMSPGTNDWYTDRFKELVEYAINKGCVFVTMEDLYQLQTGPIRIPRAG